MDWQAGSERMVLNPEWVVDGVAAQGYSVGLATLISMGRSGTIIIMPVILREDGAVAGPSRPPLVAYRAFDVIGLASNIQLPDTLPERAGLRRL